MAIRYYPSFRVKTNLIASRGEFLVDGQPYTGKYYATFDGKYFSGANPIVGSNKELEKVQRYPGAPGLDGITSNPQLQKQFTFGLKPNQEFSGQPTAYFPRPTEQEYKKGFFTRYFVKKINDIGFVTEISQEEWAKINNGTVKYDVSYYQTSSILWKLTGPVETKRVSQYDVREGISATNKRLVENLEKTFVGIKAFIGEDYLKFSRPTT